MSACDTKQNFGIKESIYQFIIIKDLKKEQVFPSVSIQSVI